MNVCDHAILYGYQCVCIVLLCRIEGLTALHFAALYGSEEIAVVCILVWHFQMIPGVADYMTTFIPFNVGGRICIARYIILLCSH